jgi:hypothetical protein
MAKRAAKKVDFPRQLFFCYSLSDKQKGKAHESPRVRSCQPSKLGN